MHGISASLVWMHCFILWLKHKTQVAEWLLYWGSNAGKDTGPGCGCPPTLVAALQWGRGFGGVPFLPSVTPSFGFGSISWSGEYRHAVKVSGNEGMTA